MSLDDLKSFKECMVSGGVLGKVFRNETYRVYTPFTKQEKITRYPPEISIITKSHPRNMVSVPTEKLYNDSIIFQESAKYLILAHEKIPSKEFTRTTKKIFDYLDRRK